MLTLSLGVLIGLLLALTGAGGGVLSVPLLVFGLHLRVASAAPVGLLAVTVAAALGAAIGLHEGVVRYRAALLMAGLGALASPLGLWLAHRTPNRPLALAFAALLLVVGARMFRQAARELHGAQQGASPPRRRTPCHLDEASGQLVWTLPCARALAGSGVLAGFLSGLLGVGSGFIIVPVLRSVTDLPQHSVLATSLAVIALVSAAGVVAASGMGQMPWPIALPFAAGAMLGLLLGRQFARHLAGPRLQQAFALFCGLMAVLLALRVR